MIDLTGRVALVTGASRGIGRAIAVKLASRGAQVVAAARGDNARAAADEIAGAGGKADAIALCASRLGSASTLATTGIRGSFAGRARSSGASRSSAGFISAQ